MTKKQKPKITGALQTKSGIVHLLTGEVYKHRTLCGRTGVKGTLIDKDRISPFIVCEACWRLKGEGE